MLRGRVVRIVPHANEDVNETWIADRDRFSYQGIYSEDRVLKPMIRDNGCGRRPIGRPRWHAVGGSVRIVKQHGGAQVGALAARNRRSKNSICWRASRAASAARISIIVCAA